MKKLKISNTIKTAWRIYRGCEASGRHRFREYYRIAFTNSFWIFVPVYGWAKYAAMMGLLARLAYGDVAGNSETISEAKRHIKPKTRSFFYAGCRVNWRISRQIQTEKKKITILCIGVVIFFSISLYILGSILIAFNLLPSLYSLSLLFFPTSLIVGSASSLLYYWFLFMSKLYLYELPLAVETNINIDRSISFAKQLVEGYLIPIRRLIFVFTVVFAVIMLITSKVINPQSKIVLNLIVGIPHSMTFVPFILLFSFLLLVSIFFGVLFIPYSTSMFLWFSLISFSGDEINILSVLYLPVTALFIPFWQSLKAVTYYQLNLASENIEPESNYS